MDEGGWEDGEGEQLKHCLQLISVFSLYQHAILSLKYVVLLCTGGKLLC